jgi:hypothetical protein
MVTETIVETVTRACNEATETITALDQSQDHDHLLHAAARRDGMMVTERTRELQMTVT